MQHFCETVNDLMHFIGGDLSMWDEQLIQLSSENESYVRTHTFSVYIFSNDGGDLFKNINSDPLLTACEILDYQKYNFVVVKPAGEYCEISHNQ